MATRDIRTSMEDSVCDVCGRTLLRGERPDVYLDGSARRSVCELCKDRALHEGWVREGTVTGYEEVGYQPERRRSLLARLRHRTEPPAPPAAIPTLRDDLDGRAWSETVAEPPEAHGPVATPGGRTHADAPQRRRRGMSISRRREAPAGPAREPRHVRAVPTSAEQKVVAAIEQFNDSKHPRTVAGVARSLGAPTVAVIPSSVHSSQVSIAISWELCWYRYEVDLSDEVPSVRDAGQGYELSELAPRELQGNAAADDRGSLHLAG